MKQFTSLAVFALSLALLLGCSRSSPIQVQDPWVRSAKAGMNSAAYFTLVNNSGEARSLVDARSDLGDTAVHETVKSDDGTMVKMQHVDSCRFPPTAR